MSAMLLLLRWRVPRVVPALLRLRSSTCNPPHRTRSAPSTPPHPRSSPIPTRAFSLSNRTMSEIKSVNTLKAAQPVGPYSQAVIAGPQIFVSGQIPADAEGKLVEGSIADKTRASCEGVRHILEAAGSSISRVVKVTVFLTTMEHFAEMNSVYEQYFTHKPSRSCVAVKELPKGVPVEIECVALAA